MARSCSVCDRALNARNLSGICIICLRAPAKVRDGCQRVVAGKSINNKGTEVEVMVTMPLFPWEVSA
jgi:hypothetical protein